MSVEELWDEAVAALLRASAYFRDGAGTFKQYAQLSVQRACWRYVLPDRRYGHNVRRPVLMAEPPSDWVTETASSAEEEAIGREEARQYIRLQVVAIPGPRSQKVV